MNNICLNMIVKNESEIIVDTFNNLRKSIEINKFIISDTGSSDDTIQVMQDYFLINNLEFEIHNDKWINFGHNRNLALSHCFGKSDYILFFDADDRLEGELKLPTLTADIYGLKYKSANSQGFIYYRNGLIRNTVAKWIGVIHETIIPLYENLNQVEIDGNYYVQTGHFGSRSSNPNKYLEDALILEEAFQNEPDTSILKTRYAHYCATSYYSHGDISKSIEWFKNRIHLRKNSPDFNEEYLAYRYLGMIYKENSEYSLAIDTWLTGWNHHSSKAELLYEASSTHGETGNYRLAYEIALWGEDIINSPIDQNYCYEENIYKYGINYLISRYGILCGIYDYPFKALVNLANQPFYSIELVDHVIESLNTILKSNTTIHTDIYILEILINYIKNNECTLTTLRNEISQLLTNYTQRA
jgi:tetratricopeptide (TPR) repeat protein